MSSINTNNNILNILNENVDVSNSKKKLYIFPFDKISDLKKKISILFDITWFKITLYWYINNNIHTSYNIYINENKYNVNFEYISDNAASDAIPHPSAIIFFVDDFLFSRKDSNGFVMYFFVT